MTPETQQSESPYCVKIETATGRSTTVPIAVLTSKQLEDFLQIEFKRLAQEAGAKGARVHNQKLAKDFLKWLHGKEQFGKWFQVAEGFSIGSTKMWEQAPLWNTIDEPMKGFRTAADNSRVFGYAGPPSAKATEVYSKYIIVDMFAKGVQGMKAEDSAKWAAGELGKIYG
jgi:hypothetical protein